MTDRLTLLDWQIIKPQLAESANPAELDRYLGDDNWWIEPKLDGSRTLLIIEGGQVSARNRQGDPRSAQVPLAALDPLLGLEVTLDAELVAGVLHMFDIPRLGTLINGSTPWAQRRAVLEALFAKSGLDPTKIRLVPVARTTAEKQAMATAATEARIEGLMLKRVDGLYEAGKRSSAWLKVKWVSTADCIVIRIGDKGHNSATLALLDPENNKVTEVGKASLNGKDPAIVVGSVVEIVYLNAGDPAAPRLYQPRIVGGPRTDKDYSECLIDQLRFQSKVAL